jgi:hypothetical protein
MKIAKIFYSTDKCLVAVGYLFRVQKAFDIVNMPAKSQFVAGCRLAILKV